jgi:hypothetical protein
MKLVQKKDIIMSSNYPGRNIKEYIKEYYEDNKNKINAIKKTHYICDICNGNYTHNNRAKHFNTKKHQTALNNND